MNAVIDTSNEATAEPQSASPWRRLGAMVYDTLLLIATLFVVTALFLPLNDGNAPTAGPPLLRIAYRLTLALAIIGFFGLFWRRQGRTLGMQVWRIVIERNDGSAITWLNVVGRLAWSVVPWLPGLLVLMWSVQPGAAHGWRIAGWLLLMLVPLNYASAWLDPRRRSWHDRFLETRIVYRALQRDS